jgi:hypothetical protein
MNLFAPRTDPVAASDLLAVAAHLHVLLRRKTGRVTDTEWMAASPEYARAMIRFAREKAESDGHAELLPLAARLDSMLPQPTASKPATATIAASLAAGLLPRDAAETAPSAPDASQRYVGRLR